MAIFAGKVLERRDTRQDYGEVRIIAIGQARGVFYTDRGAVRRIITAWPHNEKERAAWHASR